MLVPTGSPSVYALLHCNFCAISLGSPHTEHVIVIKP